MRFLSAKEPYDPSMRPISCEICGQVKPLRDTYSLITHYAIPGYNAEKQQGLAPFPCPDKQHFGCTHEHAMLAHLFCVFEHMHEGPHAEQGKDLEHPTLLDIQACLQRLIEEHQKAVESGGKV